MHRIFITGDIHGDINRLIELDLLIGNTLTKNDYVIVLGDFGVFFNDTQKTMYDLQSLEELNFTTCFVDGNHEDFTMIKSMEEIVEWNGGRAGIMPGGTIHLLRGEIYDINNKTIGVMGGADSIDRYWRIEDVSWWAAERITDADYDNFELNSREPNGRKKIDLMLSHDCPSSLVSTVKLYSGVNDLSRPTPSQVELERIEFLVKPKKWYFGHWHINKQINDRFECLYDEIKEIK